LSVTLYCFVSWRSRDNAFFLRVSRCPTSGQFPGTTDPPIQWKPGTLFSRAQRLGREANHSPPPPPSAEGKNQRRYSTFLIRLHSLRKDNFTLLLTCRYQKKDWRQRGNTSARKVLQHNFMASQIVNIYQWNKDPPSGRQMLWRILCTSSGFKMLCRNKRSFNYF
jgi:hypothetical protein